MYLYPARKRQTDVHISYMVGFLILDHVTIQADTMPQPRTKTAFNLQFNRKSCC